MVSLFRNMSTNYASERSQEVSKDVEQHEIFEVLCVFCIFIVFFLIQTAPQVLSCLCPWGICQPAKWRKKKDGYTQPSHRKRQGLKRKEKEDERREEENETIGSRINCISIYKSRNWSKCLFRKGWMNGVNFFLPPFPKRKKETKIRAKFPQVPASPQHWTYAKST